MSKQTKPIQIDGKPFIKYIDFVGGAGLSSHLNHLERRKAKYPNEFATIGGYPYISVLLSESLTQCKAALSAMQSINNLNQ